MKILNPKFLTSGYNAWFAAFVLIAVCLPLLHGSIGAAVMAHDSWWGLIGSWAFVLAVLVGTGFLVKEFLVQFLFWLRKRRGITDERGYFLSIFKNAAPSGGEKPSPQLPSQRS